MGEPLETYVCANCGETYDKGWSDVEAQAEADRDFPGLASVDAEVVCDDCYNEIRKWAEDEGVPWQTNAPALR